MPQYGYTLETGPSADSELNASVDGLAGGELRDKPIWDVPTIAGWLNRTGFAWDAGEISDGVLTFGFYNGPVTTGQYNNPHGAAETYGYAPMSADQQAAARLSLAYWDDLVPLKFVEDSTGPG